MQVFKKTAKGWQRVGKPIEIERQGEGFAEKEALYKKKGGGSFRAVEY